MGSGRQGAASGGIASAAFLRHLPVRSVSDQPRLFHLAADAQGFAEE